MIENLEKYRKVVSQGDETQGGNWTAKILASR